MTITAFKVSNEDHITEKTRPTVIQFTSAGYTQLNSTNYLESASMFTR
jgi:hypothetical protein